MLPILAWNFCREHILLVQRYHICMPAGVYENDTKLGRSRLRTDESYCLDLKAISNVLVKAFSMY
jgi:hypothetical protein